MKMRVPVDCNNPSRSHHSIHLIFHFLNSSNSFCQPIIKSVPRLKLKSHRLIFRPGFLTDFRKKCPIHTPTNAIKNVVVPISVAEGIIFTFKADSVMPTAKASILVAIAAGTITVKPMLRLFLYIHLLDFLESC